MTNWDVLHLPEKELYHLMGCFMFSGYRLSDAAATFVST